MKPLIRFFILLLSLSPALTQAQVLPKKQAVKIKRPIKIPKDKQTKTAVPAKSKTIAVTTIKKECKPLASKTIVQILNDRVARSLKVKLDREKSFINFNGQSQRLSISDYKVKKPARDWLYFMNDVNSSGAVAEYNEKTRKFYLKITFEGDGSEIKGKCPGCIRRYRDSRAPDINWTRGREMTIELNPIVHKNSIAFEAGNVSLSGEFIINGPAEAFLTPLTRFFMGKVKEAVKVQAQNMMNTPKIRSMLAGALRDQVDELKLSSIKSIETGDRNLFICNYLE